MVTVSESADGEVSATAGLDTRELAARFFVVVIVTLRDKNDSANEANFLAPHRSISHLQHAPSHLQRQAFLDQIPSVFANSWRLAPLDLCSCLSQ